MGAVYQAWDEVLEVVVALKTIRPEVAADPETARMLERRFKQELLLARRVTHKNIVRVHDMGDVGGIKYITMPFLEGEELSAILEREGKLAVPRVMKIARSVASGLVAAHAAGVVHRDLKPANIMVDADGEGLVMDFGVAGSTDAAKARTAGQGGARAAVPSDVSADQTMAGATVPVNSPAGQTMSGAVVGTVAYMAPEQARAEPVDQRADIYTLGLILYDLLLGRARASSAESAFDELNTRMVQAPPPPRTKDASIPEALDRIITRCIQPAADARYPTIADMLADLEKLDDNGKPLPMVRRLTWRIGAAAALVVASLVGATYWLARGPGVPVVHEPVSVLIADFQNGTGDRDVRPRARADDETRAGRRRVHQRLRPGRDQAHPRRAPPRQTGRTGGAGDCRQAGPGRGPLRFGGPPGQPLRGVGQSDAGGHRERHRQRDRTRVKQGQGSRRGDVAGVQGPRGARRRHVRLRETLRHGHALGDVPGRGPGVRGGHGGPVPQQVRARRSRASRRRPRWIPTSASPTRAWPSRRATSTSRRMPRST